MSGSQIQAINGASWIGSPRKVTPTIRFLTVFAWWLKQVVWRSPILTSHPTDEWECVWRVPYYSRMTICIQIHIYIYNKKHLPWGPVSSPEIRKASWCSSWKAIFGSHDHPSGPSKFLRHPCPGLRSTYGLPTVYLRSTTKTKSQTNQPASTS